MDPIKIGIGVSSIGRFLPLVGKAAGLFERENIPVEIVNQRDEERAVPDIVSGATPMGTPNAPSLVFSVLEGSDIVIVGGLLNRPAFYLAADPSIATVADLKGKRVGINRAAAHGRHGDARPPAEMGARDRAAIWRWSIPVSTTEATRCCSKRRSTPPSCRRKKRFWRRRWVFV